MKNRILAIEEAPKAMPVKPNTPAIIATTRKMNDQRNIMFGLMWVNLQDAPKDETPRQGANYTNHDTSCIIHSLLVCKARGV